MNESSVEGASINRPGDNRCAVRIVERPYIGLPVRPSGVLYFPNIYLTGGAMRGTLRACFLRSHHVENLQYYGIQGHAW